VSERCRFAAEEITPAIRNHCSMWSNKAEQSAMDKLDAMHLFHPHRGAQELTDGVARTGGAYRRWTTVIRELQSRLGVRMLQRTTRTVTTRFDGGPSTAAA